MNDNKITIIISIAIFLLIIGIFYIAVNGLVTVKKSKYEKREKIVNTVLSSNCNLNWKTQYGENVPVIECPPGKDNEQMRKK